MRKSPSLLETLTNAAATSEQKRVCPGEQEDSWKYEKKIKEIRMKELQESIKNYGILNPLIVRPRPEEFYEIISGYRRKYAAQQLKYTKVPVIIRYMLEEDAIISMVDANLQRERISSSEKAFAYKMKYDVLKRKAGRRKCSQVDYLTGKKSVEVISEECGNSPKQVCLQS